MCPDCDHIGGWQLGDGRIMCAGCGRRTSVTAGTIFDRTRTPLTVWFTACWLFASAKDGVSALSLQRTLEIGSYQTAWAMLHRLRSVLLRPDLERLTGVVEVDETYVGGEGPGLRGGRAKGKKSLVAIAVEVKEPSGLGRCRMTVLTDASAATFHPYGTANIEPGATVINDGWQCYSGISKNGYVHEPRSQRAAPARGQDPGQACCPASTASAPSSSGGYSAPTRVGTMTHICRATSTNSPSVSTGESPAAAGSSSTG